MTRIFISHSHSDEEIAFKLVKFLLAALKLEYEEILCTSNSEQGLSLTGSTITDQLKHHLKKSEALIILITADSLHSAWIPFEVGSFWTTDKPIIPILGPSLSQDDLPGPLKSFLSIPIEVRNIEYRLNDAINQIAKSLNLEQKTNRIRNDELQEFSNALRAWQSTRPVPVSQEEVEQLRAQIQELEQIRQEKEELEENYQTQKKELEQSFQYQIRQLEQELLQERSHTKQFEKLKQSYQTQIAAKDIEINRLQEQIDQLLQVVIKLKSKNGVDYTNLRNLLAAGKWEEADRETAERMQEVANRKELNGEDINNFPCEDLRTIDQLWVHYSNGRFGFSVQKNIYNDIRKYNKREHNEKEWEEFANKVGWRREERWLKHSELFVPPNTTSRGHLPVVRSDKDQVWVLREHWVLLSRVDL